jgi:hypothetical protein
LLATTPPHGTLIGRRGPAKRRPPEFSNNDQRHATGDCVRGGAKGLLGFSFACFSAKEFENCAAPLVAAPFDRWKWSMSALFTAARPMHQ